MEQQPDGTGRGTASIRDLNKANQNTVGAALEQRGPDLFARYCMREGTGFTSALSL